MAPRRATPANPAEPGLVVTTIDGDLRGPARLEIDGDEVGSTARLAWSLHLADPVLGAMARVARPLMTVAHDVVVSMGVDQFRRRALTVGIDRSGAA